VNTQSRDNRLTAQNLALVQHVGASVPRTAQHIADQITSGIQYQHASAEEKIAEHIRRMQAYLDTFDTSMVLREGKGV